MANLVVEIGNTALKAVWTEETTLGRMFRYQGENSLDFIISLTEKETPAVLLVASSSGFSKEGEQRLRDRSGRLLLLDGRHQETVSSLGLPSDLSSDRAASIHAARHLFAGEGVLVFDFGTMLSVDIVEADGTYGGGSLSPGLTTRFKAVNRYSRTLPLLGIPTPSEAVSGMTTRDAIAAGVVSGILFEIQGYLSRFPDKKAVFTGGDALYFAKKMKNPIFVICNLVMMGLALIAEKDAER